MQRDAASAGGAIPENLDHMSDLGGADKIALAPGWRRQIGITPGSRGYFEGSSLASGSADCVRLGAAAHGSKRSGPAACAISHARKEMAKFSGRSRWQVGESI